MLLPAIAIDTAMTAAAVLARLARHGFWIDASEPQAQAWIAESAGRLGLSFEQAEQRLHRSSWRAGAALRRQWNMQILWYARSVGELLQRCSWAAPDAPLLVVLDLHEHDGQPPIQLSSEDEAPAAEGVVFVGDLPVGVSLMMAMAGPSGGDVASEEWDEAAGGAPAAVDLEPRPGLRRGRSRAGRGAGAESEPLPQPVTVRAWPRLDAPDFVPARTPFTVEIGLSPEAQARVAGGRFALEVPAGQSAVEVTIELIADGLEAPDGWSRPLRVEVADPYAATATFTLVGLDPAGPEPVHLTTLEVRYVLGGTVCGTASRALVIGHASHTQAPERMTFGTAWLDQPPTATPIVLRPDALPADLTIELAKPDGNQASGRFECRLLSPHPIELAGTKLAIDLGEDARTFAHSIVGQIRNWANDPILENLLVSFGMAIGEKLPPAVFDAVRAVAAAVAPRPPAVLLVSADPYVPWELAHFEAPLDPARPPFLGAQVVLGRWLRAAESSAAPAGGVSRPPAQPPATIGVKHMAVMAGLYRAQSGLRTLPEAEREAAAIAQSYDAVQLAATTQDMKRLLDAQLTHRFQQIGGVEAIHFAGHGDADPEVSDGSMLMLSEGRPLPSILFRSAKYGGERQPLFFLNACMIGIGGELLGDMGGFPGNCLRGGFGALLGALWEVDDEVARSFALAFWKRALPTDGSVAAPVGEILRDLRAQYSAPAGQVPVHTWLAYVYYGHPRLTLQRIS